MLVKVKIAGAATGCKLVDSLLRRLCWFDSGPPFVLKDLSTVFFLRVCSFRMISDTLMECQDAESSMANSPAQAHGA
jgi:hypothetical protein